MLKLGVNIDHIASIRELRHGVEPEPVLAAFIAESAGADSIVVHLREDRRHINERDIYTLRRTVRTRLNLEMSVAQDILDIACEVKPDQATIVPEKRRELTTEGGLDVSKNLRVISKAVSILQKNNIEVSLFIDPEKRQIEATLDSGARIVELHTGRYADSTTCKEKSKYLKELLNSVKFARSKGLVVNAGHGLNYSNVREIAQVKGIYELNIGYSIICRAALIGLDKAIRQMKELIQ
jgi:pyridoxine 5-phosphate synthase